MPGTNKSGEDMGQQCSPGWQAVATGVCKRIVKSWELPSVWQEGLPRAQSPGSPLGLASPLGSFTTTPKRINPF